MSVVSTEPQTLLLFTLIDGYCTKNVRRNITLLSKEINYILEGNTRYLKLKDKVTSNIARSITSRYSKINTLDLSYSHISQHEYSSILLNTSNLTSLILKANFREMKYSTTDFVLDDIVERCKLIEELDLTDCREISDEGLEVLSENATCLCSVNLTSCENITDKGIKLLVKGCLLLTTVKLNQCDITDKGLKILSKCNKLKFVSLDYCKKISDKGVICLAENCSDTLTSISLCGSNCTDDSIISLVEHCDIEYIDIKRCYISKDAVGRLATCSNITYINISQGPKVDDDCLKSIAQGCRKISWINIDGLHGITDNALETLAQNCNNLREFYSNKGTPCGDVAMKAFGKYCPNLTKISLRECKFTDEGLVAFSRCKNITWIDCTRCLNITDKGVLEFSKGNLKQLEWFDLSHCRISYEAKDKIEENCETCFVNDHTTGM